MIRVRTIRVLACAAVVALAAASAVTLAAAQPPKAEPGNAGQGAGSDVAARVFSEIEKQLIRDYYGKHGAGPASATSKGKSKQLPPGLAKRDRLPPGLEQHIEKNGTLPPGLAKRDLPPDLESRLPHHPKGIGRKIVDTDVVLLEQATGVVLDILKDVLANRK
jgi:hypothetical protein